MIPNALYRQQWVLRKIAGCNLPCCLACLKITKLSRKRLRNPIWFRWTVFQVRRKMMTYLERNERALQHVAIRWYNNLGSKSNPQVEEILWHKFLCYAHICTKQEMIIRPCGYIHVLVILRNKLRTTWDFTKFMLNGDSQSVEWVMILLRICGGSISTKPLLLTVIHDA